MDDRAWTAFPLRLHDDNIWGEPKDIAHELGLDVSSIYRLNDLHPGRFAIRIGKRRIKIHREQLHALMLELSGI